MVDLMALMRAEHWVASKECLKVVHLVSSMAGSLAVRWDVMMVDD